MKTGALNYSKTSFGHIDEYAKRELIRSYKNGEISQRKFNAAKKAIEQDKSGDIATVSYHDTYPSKCEYNYKVATLENGSRPYWRTDLFKSFTSAVAYANLFAEAVRTETPEVKEQCAEKMADIFIKNGDANNAIYSDRAFAYGNTKNRAALQKEIVKNIEETKKAISRQDNI